MLTGPGIGGVAWTVGGVCYDPEGYEVSGIDGHFPYPIQHRSFDNWDLYVVSHEFGHTFGSPHTFDYSPPIECDDGTGPDHGTIMSYCAASFGLVGVGMRFHPRVQDLMRAYIPTRPCVAPMPFQLGDYDYDGDLDDADLAAFDAYLAQGFHSEGCVDAFDMDGDRVVTACDRRLLVELIRGPGESFCFGEGCPCGNDGVACHGCGSSTGSVGAGGTLFGDGTSSVAADDLLLVATGLPAHRFGLVFMGSSEPDHSFGDGRRCVGGQIFRFPVRNTGYIGQIAEGPGIVAQSRARFASPGHIQAGQT